jgi:hypothetical protein
LYFEVTGAGFVGRVSGDEWWLLFFVVVVAKEVRTVEVDMETGMMMAMVVEVVEQMMMMLGGRTVEGGAGESRADIPEHDRPIAGSGCEVFAVWREGDGPDTRGVALKAVLEDTCRGVPKLDGAVARCGGEVQTVG